MGVIGAVGGLEGIAQKWSQMERPSAPPGEAETGRGQQVHVGAESFLAPPFPNPWVPLRSYPGKKVLGFFPVSFHLENMCVGRGGGRHSKTGEELISMAISMGASYAEAFFSEPVAFKRSNSGSNSPGKLPRLCHCRAIKLTLERGQPFNLPNKMMCVKDARASLGVSEVNRK